MFKIIYRTGIYCYKTKVPLHSGGMIASFCGNREVTICSPKSRAIGFFAYDGNVLFETGIASICIGQGEYQTDVYEPGKYEIEDLLYCSPNGKITNNPEFKGQLIGIVNHVCEEYVGFITAFSYQESI